ncbi:hypothetical protein FB451DRAFT_1176838 [Mycena latifolia]|nr:hypothetical protein FB451DRAFT_1176838 [Mycena latifolia]
MGCLSCFHLARHKAPTEKHDVDIPAEPVAKPLDADITAPVSSALHSPLPKAVEEIQKPTPGRTVVNDATPRGPSVAQGPPASCPEQSTRKARKGSGPASAAPAMLSSDSTMIAVPNDPPAYRVSLPGDDGCTPAGDTNKKDECGDVGCAAGGVSDGGAIATSASDNTLAPLLRYVACVQQSFVLGVERPVAFRPIERSLVDVSRRFWVAAIEKLPSPVFNFFGRRLQRGSQYIISPLASLAAVYAY